MEIRPHGVGDDRVLAQDVEVQLVGPPVAIARTRGRMVGRPGVDHGAEPLAHFGLHVSNDGIVMLGHVEFLPCDPGWIRLYWDGYVVWRTEQVGHMPQ